MRTSIAVLLAILFLSIFSNAFGQSQEIKRDEYYGVFREAFAKSRRVSRRVVQSIKGMRNGKPYSEEWIYEYQMPDRIRYVHITTFAEETRRTEQINIGDTIHCRKENGKWEVSKRSCIGGGVGSGGPSGIISERFEREKTKQGNQELVCYGQYYTYKNTYSTTAETDGPSFWETSFWLDKSGMLVRYETKRGLVPGPLVSFEMVEIYEYDPNIKIEAPIP